MIITFITLGLFPSGFLWSLSAVIFTILLILISLLFHFHVHQYLNAGLNVLQNGERIRSVESFALFVQNILIVSINLYKYVRINVFENSLSYACFSQLRKIQVVF